MRLAVRFRSLLAAAALSAAALVIAAPTTLAQGLKVAVFDKQKIVDESKLGLASKTRFEKLQSDREAEVTEKQKALETLQASYKQKEAVLSEDKKLDMQRELARSRDELQSAAANADKDLQRAYQSAIMDMLAKVDPVIESYGKTNGYDILFDKTQVSFNKDALDVTADIIAKLDALHPE